MAAYFRRSFATPATVFPKMRICSFRLAPAFSGGMIGFQCVSMSARNNSSLFLKLP